MRGMGAVVPEGFDVVVVLSVVGCRLSAVVVAVAVALASTSTLASTPPQHPRFDGSPQIGGTVPGRRQGLCNVVA